MTCITVSRQLGSQGCAVAREVANRLEYKLVWRELINQAARQAGVPEVALDTIDELGLLGLHPSREARLAYHNAVRQIMEELASQGKVVIVGRAGQAILRERPDALHVKIIAPEGLRAERLAARKNISPEAAAAQVQASDRARRDYLRRYYQARWDDPQLYDLVLNTARLSVPQAADLVCQAALQGLHPFVQTQPSDGSLECE